MPRSRNSRSASPQKSVSAESVAEFEQRKILQSVHEIFSDTIDADVIRLVLQECSWREEEAVDKLLLIAENHEEQRKYKSKLHRIAEGVFGSLRSEDYGHNLVTAASSLSPSEKVIRRPSKPASSGDKNSSNTTKLQNVSSSEKLLARGLAPPIYSSGLQESGSSTVDEIEMDLHFAPTKFSETNFSSASSSVSSQKSHNEQVKPPSSSKTVLLSQAQSAFNQQFDDAEGTQRWEQYKQKLSEHYLVNLTKDKQNSKSKGQNSNKESFPEDPAILQAELEGPTSGKAAQKDIERPRSETSRNFPVRLLSRSPDTVEDDVPVPGSISGQNARSGNRELIGSSNIDSSELDETVFKCIYEIHGDLLDEKELGTLTKNSEGEKSSTPTSFRQAVVSPAGKPAAQQSNEAMTLPTIGLSVNAVEFVPRPKSATTVPTASSPTEVIDTSPQPASKMPISSSIEIKSGVKNVQRNQSAVSIGSPLTISPSISPGISPPTSHINNPATNLTGSPMFITPKWPQLFHTINHPPPLPPSVLASTTSRFVTPSHAHLSPPGFRFPQATPLPYSSRMVYSVAPPPLFRMAGVPRYVQQPNLQVGENIDERAAIATGQPIMATSEASRLISPSAKLVNLTYIEQKIEKIQSLQKSGLKVLVIVRGLPGSGKTTLARHLQLNGIVLSTDDYFMKGNVYTYNPDKLTEAHQWNRERSKEAMRMGKSPVIIDNTNTQTWEFKPYISMAVANNYHIELVEPNTPWKYKVNDLARRTLHGVPKDQIERMCNRYEHNISVDTLTKKKKSDTKSNDNESTENLKLEEDTPSSPEISTNLSPTTDVRGVKDLRVHNPGKVEELRKQRSAESDSDSISSYHSGSLSNQSSRNASPKPLRPSLKTPGVLQKMEKRNHPLKTKQESVKQSVKRVDRKAIKKMESILSSETIEVVNEMVNEHVGDRLLSIDDVTKLEEELKALLVLYPLVESEVPLAEELIGLKLHDIINQSSESPEVENYAEAETSDAESSKDTSNEEIKFEVSTVTDEFSKTRDEEFTDKFSNTEGEDKVQTELDEYRDIETEENDGKTREISEGEDTNAIEIDLLKNGLHNESKAMQSGLKLNKPVSTSTERNFPSWTEIASNDTGKDSSIFSNMENNNFIDSFGFIEKDNSIQDKVCISLNEFESQYWGNTVESSNDTEWDDNECSEWNAKATETNIGKSEKGAKPQRKKRNKSIDPVTSETSENNPDLLEEEFENENFVDCVEDIDEKLQGEDNVCLNDNIDEDLFSNANSEVEICTNSEGQKANIVKMKECLQDKSTLSENSNNEDIICSSIDTNGSQDSFHGTCHHNSSLQMLKESYTDVESTIQTIVNNKEREIGLDNVEEHCQVSANDMNSIKSDYDVNTETLSEKKPNGVESEENNKHLVQESNESVTILQDDRESLKSNESLKSGLNSEKENKIRVEAEILVDSSLNEFNKPVSSLPQKSKKQTRRKMAANLMGPFLNSEDKEKFKSNSWNSFPIHSVEKSNNITSSSHSKLSNEKDVINAMTMTDIEYFNIVLRLNQGCFVDSSIRYLSGNPRKLLNGLNTNSDLKSVNEKHTLEKSTSTDDFVTLTDSESIEFLQTCFPTVPKAELECVLDNCANNSEWAINLLLDWKYSLHLTSDEKRKFTDGMAEVKKGSSQTKSDNGPKSLLDMCFSMVEHKKIASREEIEKQLIQTGKERLDRIEDDNITKIRLRRSTSLSESSFDIGSFTPKRNDLSVFRSNSSPAEIREGDQDHTENNGSVKESVNENKVEGDINDRDDLDNETRSYRNIDKNLGIATYYKLEEESSASNDINVTEVMDNHVPTEEYDFDVKPSLTMNIDTEIIGKLEDMFGPLGNRSDVKDDLSVPLDRKTAWMMYQCVKKGIILTRSQQRREQQQLIKDEELARQLQEEENAFIKPKNRNQKEDNVSSSRGRKGTPLVGLSVLGTIPQLQEPVAWSRGNQTLAEIMQEEERIQESQKEFVKLIEKEGGQTAIATCLKRQKLYGRFPRVDKKLLDEIFQANCFNLSETIDSISTSLGEMGTTSVTMVTHGQGGEEKLLEATKQQSMQEMLDSYIYHPVASKDYQDGADPEYEDFRGEANLHYRLRHECFQKAREAYRRGLKQVATFYSQQGHMHTQKIKEANMRASENILEERNHDIEKNQTLDLHGLHVDEAIAALNRIIPKKERERCKKLIIITGRGSHSRGGVARLRPSVIAYLNSNKYSFTELQTGVFNVSLKKY